MLIADILKDKTHTLITVRATDSLKNAISKLDYDKLTREAVEELPKIDPEAIKIYLLALGAGLRARSGRGPGGGLRRAPRASSGHAQSSLRISAPRPRSFSSMRS